MNPFTPVPPALQVDFNRPHPLPSGGDPTPEPTGWFVRVREDPATTTTWLLRVFVICAG